jgi:L-glyceraldehyde 3-phosphate reductase
VSERRVSQVRALNEIAKQRNQSVAQLALAWVLRDPRMTSALIGASKVEQVRQNVAGLNGLNLSSDESAKIEAILSL